MGREKETEREYFAQVIKFQAELQGFVAAMLPFHPDDAQDVVQSINEDLVRRAGDFAGPRRFRGWIYRIARARIADFIRAKSAERLVFSEETVERFANEKAEEPESDVPLLKRLAVCRRRLSEKHRKMLEMRYERNMQDSEIAHEFGTTRNTVTVTFFRIRRKLHECMLQGECTAIDGEETPVVENLEEVLRHMPMNRARKRAFLESVERNKAMAAEWLVQAFVESLLSGKARLAVRKPPIAAKWLWTVLASTAVAGTIWTVSQRKTADVPIPVKETPKETTEMKTQMLALPLVAASMASAADVYEAQTQDTRTTSSFTRVNWSADGGATLESPVSGHDYLAPEGSSIWSPETAATFAGDSLQLGRVGAAKNMQMVLTSDVTFNKLILANGKILNAKDNSTLKVNGPVEVIAAKSAPFQLVPEDGNNNSRAIEYTGALSGSGHLAVNTQRDSVNKPLIAILSGNNSEFTGTMNVRGKNFVLRLDKNTSGGGDFPEMVEDAFSIEKGGELRIGPNVSGFTPLNRGLTVGNGGGYINNSRVLVFGCNTYGDGALEKLGSYMEYTGVYGATGNLTVRSNWLVVKSGSFTGSRNIIVYGGLAGTTSALSGQSVEVMPGGALAVTEPNGDDASGELELQNATIHAGTILQWKQNALSGKSDVLTLSGIGTTVENDFRVRITQFTYTNHTLRLPVLTVPQTAALTLDGISFDQSQASSFPDRFGLVTPSFDAEEVDGVRKFYVVFDQNVVTMLKSHGAGKNWSHGEYWSDAQSARSGFDYLVQATSSYELGIRSPDTNQGTHVFPGNSLVLAGVDFTHNANFALCSKWTQVDDLRLRGYAMITLPRQYGVTTLSGNISATGFNYVKIPNSANRSVLVNSSVHGSGTIKIFANADFSGNDTFVNKATFSSTESTYSGAWQVDDSAHSRTPNGRIYLEISSEANLGASPSSKLARGIELINFGGLWPSSSIILQDANRCLYVNQGELRIDEGKTLENKLETTVATECDLAGGGTIAFARSVTGGGTIYVKDSTLRADISDFTGVSLKFADGAKLAVPFGGSGVKLSSVPVLEGKLAVSFAGDAPEGAFTVPVFTVPAGAEIDTSAIVPAKIDKCRFAGWKCETTDDGVCYSAEYKAATGTIIMLLGGN